MYRDSVWPTYADGAIENGWRWAALFAGRCILQNAMPVFARTGVFCKC
uniref:Uncharacterized protein n=1 Tax=Sinorhizobium arboris TaxID=76745 RepID=D1CSI9_9HYPH|nr:hypothetical protein [Sinorhizobium arboris LMG 14919]